MIKTIAIAGAGQAAGRAVHGLRGAGYDGRIFLVGDESLLPYERPPLSKGFLTGEQTLDTMLLNSGAFYQDAAVDLVTGRRAQGIDLRDRRLVLEDGLRLEFDALLLATGSRARELPGLPTDNSTVFSLRNHADAIALQAQLEPGRRIVLIGGGFIGLEVAVSAHKQGCSVTVLEAAPELLARVLGSEIGRAVEAMLTAAGIDIRKSVRLAGVDLGAAGGARLRLEDGATLDADSVVVGIGAVPNTELAQSAGLACDDGILVDAFAAASAPGIFAAGDVTRHPSAFYGRAIRLETWDNAEKQAIAAVQAMLGQPKPYDEIPWMWTDLLGRNIQILGLAAPCEQRITRGRFGDGPFVSLGLLGGRIVQAIMVDAGRERRPLTKLMREGNPVAPERLADEALPLRSL